MSTPPARGETETNLLLATLPEADRQDLLAAGRPVRLETGQVVIPAHQSIRSVYFVRSGLLSLLVLTEEGGSVEGATVGREGMVGLSVFLEADPNPWDVTCQIAGDAFCLPAERFKQAADESRALHRALHRYTLALMNQVARTAACNRLHTVEQRLARWLLLCRDRLGSDELPLTQEALGRMLGTRRVSVSLEAGGLQQAGLIGHTRGRITILDPAGLEAVACEDYRLTVQEYDRLLG